MVILGLMGIGLGLLAILYGTVAEAFGWQAAAAAQRGGTLGLMAAMAFTGVVPTQLHGVSAAEATILLTQVFLVVLPLLGSVVMLQSLDDGSIA